MLAAQALLMAMVLLVIDLLASWVQVAAASATRRIIHIAIPELTHETHPTEVRNKAPLLPGERSVSATNRVRVVIH